MAFSSESKCTDCAHKRYGFKCRTCKHNPDGYSDNYEPRD